MLFGYARISSESQNLDMQLEALRKYGCRVIFSEAITGIAKVKPEFESMKKDLQKGDTVVVYAFSRISRSLVDMLHTINDLREKEVKIISLTEPIDTTTPTGEAFLQMIGIFAQLERKIMIERITEGSRLARSRNQGGGRKMMLDDKQVSRLKKLHSEKKMSVKEIGAMFGLSRAGVYKYLKR